MFICIVLFYKMLMSVWILMIVCRYVLIFLVDEIVFVQKDLMLILWMLLFVYVSLLDVYCFGFVIKVVDLRLVFLLVFLM